MPVTLTPGVEEQRFTALLRRQEKKRGFLVAFEGPDGSGKTTQRKLFKTWLRSVGHDVVTYKWNASPIVEPILKARKLAHSLSPEEYCVLSAAAFRHQLETEVLPALWEGKMVVADRFLFTALARDTARGLDLNWVMNSYVPLFWPDLVFYFELSAELSSQRISANKKPSYYEAGQDVTNISDPQKSHRQFVGRVIQEYEALSKIFQFLKVDARQSIYEQHRAIRQMFMLGHRRPWAEWNTEAVTEWMIRSARTSDAEIAEEKNKKTSGKPPDRKKKPKSIPPGKLISLEGAHGRDLEKAAQELVEQHAGQALAVSRWDASNTFYELRLGKAKRLAPPPRTLLLLYAADLLFRLRWEIRPALAEGHTLVVAPYLETAIGFGLAAGLPKEWLENLFSFAPKADACFRIKEKARLKKKEKNGGAHGFVEFGSQSLVASSPGCDPAKLRVAILEYLDALEEKGEIRRLGKKLPKVLAKK